MEAARERVGASSSTFSFAVLDSTTLPFGENSFDVVLAFGLLDHLPDALSAANENSRGSLIAG